MLDSIHFARPALFLTVLPLLLAIAHRFLFRGERSSVGFSAWEWLQARLQLDGTWRKALRLLLLLLVVLGLGILWAEPSYHSTKPLFSQVGGTYHKNFVVALDMSPSMNLPSDFKGYGGEDLKAGETGRTRYEMARAALVDFLTRFRGERFGLILFSTEPLLARWPTVETSTNFAEVLESIRRGSGTQLEAFSGLTNVDKALSMARQSLGERGGAIILISDAEDDLESLGDAVRNIRQEGIRLYTIGVGIPDGIIAKLAGEFAHDPGFRIFRVDSEEEMREAYRLVAEVEESPRLSADGRYFESDVRWIGCLLLLATTGCALLVTEIIWPEATCGRSDAFRTGRHGI